MGRSSREILLVASWKMYDVLLLKASERKFRCLDASPIPFHPPLSLSLLLPQAPTSPRHDEMGINVNRMTARSRKTALQYRIKESGFYLRSSA